MPTVGHISDDTLKMYSMGRLGEAEVTRVKEHLLFCEECQERLKVADDFIATMRQDADEDPSLRKPRRRSAWAHLKVILGSAITLGYVYNVAVGRFPASHASALEKWGYYGGTVIGILTGILLIFSGLRKTVVKR